MKYLTMFSIIYVFLIMWGAWGVDISMGACNVGGVVINYFGIQDLNKFYHMSLVTILVSTFLYVMYVLNWCFNNKGD